MLEYCIREDLKLKRSRVMAILDPVKLIIDNYPEGQIEELDAPNNLENENSGNQKSTIWQRTVYRERGLYGRTAEKIFPSVPGQ